MIIITGASGGIGSSVVTALSQRDTIICLYNTHKPENIPADDNIRLIQLDITNENEVIKFIAQQKNILKQITIVHFAAVKIDGLVMTFDFTDWKKVMDVNVNGNFLLTSKLLPLMIHDKWGRIIHISSIAGEEGQQGSAAYSASKAMLGGWSKSLAKEYGRFNITSNILALGYFELGLMNMFTEAVREKLISEIPSRKAGKTSNIVNAINFLVDSEFVNGAQIDINGGI
jgi:NAD(P)-dependent dehydrogenase (short-subunit alcohol dehydrogenase family)